MPRHVLRGPGYTAPSDQLVLAAIGARGKGTSDIKNASVNGREKVIALCDGNFSGSAKRSVESFPKAKLYNDYREMLDKEKDIDAVTISTPDHVHALAAAFAMQRGKHVYVQKPMTHNIREARILTQRAHEKKVVTQMGNQGASNPLLKMVQGWIDSGKLGKISKVDIWTNRTKFGPESGPNDEPEYGHQRKWVDACKAGFGSKEHKELTSSFDYAGPMTETVLMGNLAIRSYMLRKEGGNNVNYYGRKKLLWDGENMKITNREEPNQFVGRKYRKGWEV